MQSHSPFPLSLGKKKAESVTRVLVSPRYRHECSTPLSSVTTRENLATRHGLSRDEGPTTLYYNNHHQCRETFSSDQSKIIATFENKK